MKTENKKLDTVNVENFKGTLKFLHKNDLMFMFLGSIVSADSNMNEKEVDANLEISEVCVDIFKEMEKNGDPDINSESVKTYLGFAEKSVDILKKDKENFKE